LSQHFTHQSTISDALLNFCDILNEVQSLYSVLFDKAQNFVTKGINSFLNGELKKSRDCKKSFYRVSDELNSVTNKNAGISRQKPTEADELSTLLQTALVEFTHNALDYSYQINVISCSKGHHLITHLLSYVSTLTTFYHQGSEALKTFEPFINDLTIKVMSILTEGESISNCPLISYYMYDSINLCVVTL
jgi:hypothetical protein